LQINASTVIDAVAGDCCWPEALPEDCPEGADVPPAATALGRLGKLTI
jgi:hypothetical protein